MLTRSEITALLIEAKTQKNLTFAQIAAAVGRHEVWTTSAIFGQQSMSSEEAKQLCEVLELDGETTQSVVQVLVAFPMKGSLETPVPVDPLLYRFYELIQVYGPTWKAIINEKFGDGIMSAIDFHMSIEKEENPNGDRVVVTMNGKFLPYRKW